MTEQVPAPPPTAPEPSTGEPASPPASGATPWVIVLLCIALGLAFFIFLALIATWDGAPGA